MEALHYKINYEKIGDAYDFYPIGDIHLGAYSCDEDLLVRDLKRIRENPFARVLLMGDLGDFIGRNDPRFDSNALADWIPVRKVSTLLETQVGRIVDHFKPIADQGKIIGALMGNHEEKVAKHYGFDIHGAICRQLMVSDLGYSALIRLKFKRSTVGHTLVIYAHHGHGGGRKSGSKINRIHDAGADFEADIYLMGHTHERGWAPMKPMLVVDSREEKIVSRERVYGMTGSYLKTFERGMAGYGEIKGFPPVSLGGIHFTYKPEYSELETFDGVINMRRSVG